MLNDDLFLFHIYKVYAEIRINTQNGYVQAGMS